MTASQEQPASSPAQTGVPLWRRHLPSLVMGVGTVVVLLMGAVLFWRAQSQTNKVSLSGEAKGVTVVEAKSTTYRPSRRYVGTLDPWVEANIGPQLVSAYVETVLVRPGASVKRGDVIATLDCRNASATSKAVSMQARALESTQEALTHEAQRIQSLEDGGFVSVNEVEQKTAESASKQAQLLALQAQMLGSSLQVSDCVLKAPFDGEVADRMKDPGAFVKPGTPIASIIDRRLIRVSADVPEGDFASVAPGTSVKIRVLATGKELIQPIVRRTPAADPGTRTVHIEIDVEDPEKEFPVFTTAELSIDVGEPLPATELPLAVAAIRGRKASIFVVNGDKAHAVTVPVMGEAAGRLFVDPQLKAGTKVVLEGRMLLNDGDLVSMKVDDAAMTERPAESGKEGRP